jgi:hypothetical protein
MKAITTDTNQYRGINAHLHSLYQHDSDKWQRFHSVHITHVAMALQDILLPLGYEAQPEAGLQVRLPGQNRGQPRSDIAIMDRQPSRRFPIAVPVAPIGGQRVMPLPDLLTTERDEEDEFMAIAIRQDQPETDEDGPIIAWIELLSPGNKPGGSNFSRFTEKRRDLLELGIVYIELDYLHASPASFETVPSYQPRKRGGQREVSATPYRITVIDPRPVWNEGEGRFSEFTVDDPIPNVIMPLAGTDRISFDFNVIYQYTFKAMYFGRRINYAALPVAFELYSPDDQARILSRMIAVLQAAARGENLEQPPRPIDCLPLDEARRIFERLTA